MRLLPVLLACIFIETALASTSTTSLFITKMSIVHTQSTSLSSHATMAATVASSSTPGSFPVSGEVNSTQAVATLSSDRPSASATPTPLSTIGGEITKVSVSSSPTVATDVGVNVTAVASIETSHRTSTASGSVISLSPTPRTTGFGSGSSSLPASETTTVDSSVSTGNDSTTVGRTSATPTPSVVFNSTSKNVNATLQSALIPATSGIVNGTAGSLLPTRSVTVLPSGSANKSINASSLSGAGIVNGTILPTGNVTILPSVVSNITVTAMPSTVRIVNATGLPSVPSRNMSVGLSTSVFGTVNFTMSTSFINPNVSAGNISSSVIAFETSSPSFMTTSFHSPPPIVPTPTARLTLPTEKPASITENYLVIWLPVAATGGLLLLLLVIASCYCWVKNRRSDRYDFSVVNYYSGQEMKSPTPATNGMNGNKTKEPSPAYPGFFDEQPSSNV
eukprot:m.6507 g.6507  ORF g.6507 m.6507 type:complete len:450 (+) comp16065_c0_seq1:192-1541(+)